MILSIILILLFAALQYLDVKLTVEVIALGGIEKNPIVNKIGWFWTKVLKVAVTVLVAIPTISLSWIIVVLPIIIMIAVCLWNYSVLTKLRGSL